MADAPGEMREQILRQCAASAPGPWYPSVFARDNPVPREQFDHDLNELRLGGLVRIVDWAQGKGQGYALTPEGESLLQNDRQLAQLRRGKLELRPEPQPVSRERSGLEENAFERGELVRRAVFSPERTFVTPALIFLNVAVFVAGMVLAAQNNVPANEYLSGSGNANLKELLDRLGALSGAKILEGQWFRLLSCCFVHFGLLHLGVNMYSLYAVGSIQEGMWGKSRYLALYLIAGVGGSCAMVINDPRTFGAGASGAVFGLAGSLGTWIVLNRKHLGPMAGRWLRRLVIVLVLNIVISSMPGISASAHFGGFVVGIVAAALLHVCRFGHGLTRALAHAALFLVPAVCIGAVLQAERIDPKWGVVEWIEIVRPRVEDRWNEASELERDQVGPLLAPRQKNPPPERKEQLRVAFTRILAKLDEGIALLKNAGPYRQIEIEEERKSFLRQFGELRRQFETRMQLTDKAAQEGELQTELTRARSHLADMVMRKLENKATWNQQDEQQYVRQQQAVKDLENRLHQLHN